MSPQKANKANTEPYGYRFSLSDPEDWVQNGGEPAFMFYLTVYNLLTEARTITLSLASYVRQTGEQLSQDTWLSGYLAGTDTILEKAHRKAGLWFLKRHVPEIVRGDYVVLDATIPDCDEVVTLRFTCLDGVRAGGSCWRLTGATPKPSKKETEKTSSRASRTLPIERLEAFEDRAGVYLSALTANLTNDNRLTVLGELHPRGGTGIDSTIYVCMDLYDESGGLVHHGVTWFNADTFFGYGAFRFFQDHSSVVVSKVRLYPSRTS